MQPVLLLLMQYHTSHDKMECGDWKPGASCSKLTMSSVKDLLKFQTSILQIHSYFLSIKCENRILTFDQQK